MFIQSLVREFRLSSKDRTLWFWVISVFILSVIAVGSGLAEINSQKTAIEKLVLNDQQDRMAERSKLYDWGSAAYYQFHLTYQPPSDFAFAALGKRDTQPWKHRIRMLALEGQIYERDVGNPSFALIGRFDFAFLAAFIFPLAIIMLLFDLRSSEMMAGRYELLEATVGHTRKFWLLRAFLRSGLPLIALLVPLVIGGLISGSAPSKLLTVLVCLF